MTEEQILEIAAKVRQTGYWDRFDIIRMAREAGFLCVSDPEDPAVITDDPDCIVTAELERFAALVAAHEREACAKFVENCNGELGCQGYLIRARGKSERREEFFKEFGND